MDTSKEWIKLKNVSENNLKSVSLQLPRNKFIVITGVSGSGKSSLVFDVIHGEGRRKYFENLNLQARQLMGKLQKPRAEEILNLTPTLALSQSNFGNNPRSTVGTLTEIFDHLRLLFARIGKTEDSDTKLTQSLLSFNSPMGACRNCNGLGLEDKIDPQLLIEDENKSIRNRCFKITNPKGYIIYSQVTIDALNEVCKAHGFDVNIPWKDLTPEQQEVVMNGSDRIKIPYGKHTLESRMRWSGITAKPREEGYYKGILPVMDQILQRDRNPNILRFSKTQICSHCQGKRLSPVALEVKVGSYSISDLVDLSLDELKYTLQKISFSTTDQKIADPIFKLIFKKTEMLTKLGLGYLSCSRRASTLSGGELQRIQLTKLVTSKLRNITFVFDEPSVGVHPANHQELISTIRKLVRNGNTAIVVEHDACTIQQADWIAEVGPGAGKNGGEILFNGLKDDFLKSKHNSPTREYLQGKQKIKLDFQTRGNTSEFSIKNAAINNLKNISPEFLKNRLNVLTGVSGAGKSSLINQTLLPLLRGKYEEQLHAKGNPAIENADFKQVIAVDRSPIGKNARSTPATYTKVFDQIRSFFANLPEAKSQKFSAGTLSFNTGKGRCETCEGAGKLEVGMHFLGNVETLCQSCWGQRYKPDVLQILHKNKNIADVLNMSVKEAQQFFDDQPKIKKHLEVMNAIGLGYLKLGQSSGTLSGGEAQRVKLATEIIKSGKGQNLFVFDEPTTGLHFHDIQVLLDLFSRLLKDGNTILAIEHHPDFIKNAHWVIDLGPGSAKQGGEIVFQGTPEELNKWPASLTGKFLTQDSKNQSEKIDSEIHESITFKGVSTNNLNIPSVSFPHNKHTVITGKSGSGKSSLAFDTLFAEAQNRFVESFPAYVRRFMGKMSQADFEYVEGLTPALALKQNLRITDPRSTLGTLTEIFDHYRLLFARFGNAESVEYHPLLNASLFSFNNTEGSCPTCSGLGYVLTSTSDILIQKPDLSIEDGALGNHKSLRFYTDPFGQYMAMLHTIGKKNGIDFSSFVKDLTEEALQIAFYGLGKETFDVNWKFNRKGRIGSHNFTGKWRGFVALLLEEYYRKNANGKGEDLRDFLFEDTCQDCKGQRFKPEILNVRFCGHNIHSITMLSIRESMELFEEIQTKPAKFELGDDFGKLQSQILGDILQKLTNLSNLGLDYLHLDRQSKTLSGGELQRAFLSTHLTGGLTGMTYVLDEPSTGLHPVDTERINASISKIVKQGNTVVTVEHNLEIIRNADHIIETGPGAGNAGGRITNSGSPDEFIHAHGLTAKMLKQKPVFNPLSKSGKTSTLQIFGAKANNLKNITVALKTNCLNAVTGVSGSGKTTLLRDVVIPSLNTHRPINCQTIEGAAEIENAIWIDKSYQQAAASSVVATYIGVFDAIRLIFSKTADAKHAGLKANDFSFNSKSGQCPDCKGNGHKHVALDFMADVDVLCETCAGKRFKSHVLKIRLKENDIAEVLEMNIEEAIQFFKDQTKIAEPLQTLNSLGLGYLKLGQTTKTLSGGENQRLKIAREIISQNNVNNLFVFDEPSRGLHPTDLKYLINLAELLIKKQNTVVFIEHNPHIICRANHVIDLGPGAGKFGGEVVYQGDLSSSINSTESLISTFIKPFPKTFILNKKNAVSLNHFPSSEV